MEPAGFGKRLLAYILDTVILSIIMSVLIVPGFIVFLASESPFLLIIGNLLSLPVVIFYSIILPATKYQGTPGKVIMKIKIVNSEGKRISILQSFVIVLAKMLSSIFYIGYLMILFSADKRSLHDIISKTYVVTK